MDFGLHGKRALVLGSTRGLGFAVAQALVEEGVGVILCGRSQEKLDQAAQGLAGSDRTVDTCRIDLADRASIDAALTSAPVTMGRIDILVNNSGGPAPGGVTDIATEAWTRNFEAMATSLFHITAQLLPAMRAARWGRIVTIASSGVVQPIPNLALSNALRASVIGWAKTLASEVAADGVTVNTVLPGRIRTERVAELDSANAKRSGRAVADVQAESLKSIPVGRVGEPREFGDVVAFLASQRASYITGSVVRVDGGMIRSV